MKTMTTLKLTKLVMIFFTAFSLVTSCKNDDDDEVQATVYPEEMILSSYLSTTGYNQANTAYVNSGNYEFGLVFTPQVNGAIKSLKVNIPDTNSNLRITIWDVAANTVVRTETVNVATANADVSKTISPINLEKAKKYAITMNSADWNNRKKTNNSAATYPVTAGNIVINEYRWASSTTVQQIFPTNIGTDYYAGDVDFVFQQTN